MGCGGQPTTAYPLQHFAPLSVSSCSPSRFYLLCFQEFPDKQNSPPPAPSPPRPTYGNVIRVWGPLGSCSSMGGTGRKSWCPGTEPLRTEARNLDLSIGKGRKRRSGPWSSHYF